MLEVTPFIHIKTAELDFTFARSSGPGGQNVNKVNSKAVLRWSVVKSEGLPEPVRARFLETYASKLTRDGEVLLSSDEYRDQGRNVTACLDKLREMILAVAHPPKKRKVSGPTKGAKRRRVQTKRLRSEKKQTRGRVRSFD